MVMEIYTGTRLKLDSGVAVRLCVQYDSTTVEFALEGDTGAVSVKLTPDDLVKMATGLLREHNLLVYGFG